MFTGLVGSGVTGFAVGEKVFGYDQVWVGHAIKEQRTMDARMDLRANPRLPSSTERVLSAAVVLADTGGIDSLSMRRLARTSG